MCAIIALNYFCDNLTFVFAVVKLAEIRTVRFMHHFVPDGNLFLRFHAIPLIFNINMTDIYRLIAELMQIIGKAGCRRAESQKNEYVFIELFCLIKNFVIL